MDAELATRISARTVPLPLRLLGDERLARLVGSGHEEAFSILYQRHHQALYRYCRSLVGTDADAQDALQSAMTGALVALRVGRRDAPIRPWLFRIVYNESMSQLRRRRPVTELVEELPALDGSPESAVEQRHRLSRLLADLRELPERQRGALVMRELSGLSHQEVAESLGVSVGAAKQMVFEARRSLLEFDQGRAMACDDIRRMISDGDGRSLRGRRVRAHLRECGGCAAFAAAIPQRRTDLHAMAPALPAAAAAGMLFRITGAGSGQSGGGSAGVLGGATGKAVAAGVSSKLVATGTLIVATAAVGTGGILHAISPSAPAGHTSSLTRSATGSSSAGARHHSAATSRRSDGARHGAAGRSAAARAAAHQDRSGSPGVTGRGASGSSAAATHSHGRGDHGSANSAAGTGGRHLGTQKGSTHGSSSTTKPAHPTTSQAPAKPVVPGSSHQKGSNSSNDTGQSADRGSGGSTAGSGGGGSGGGGSGGGGSGGGGSGGGGSGGGGSGGGGSGGGGASQAASGKAVTVLGSAASTS